MNKDNVEGRGTSAAVAEHARSHAARVRRILWSHSSAGACRLEPGGGVGYFCSITYQLPNLFRRHLAIGMRQNSEFPG